MSENHTNDTPGADETEELEGPAASRDLWLPPAEMPTRVTIGGSRAETAAGQIARLAATAQAGERIGSKDDLRKLCGFSVGTMNEAIKLAQARGVITSRPGPGGGIFACDPSPLSRMNGWFRAAADDSYAFAEAVQIRDAIAPLLVDEVLRQMTLDDQDVLAERLWEVRRARNSLAVSDFIWACWALHQYVAGIGKSQLLDTLYLSIMDVGTSYLRAVLEARESRVHLDGLAQVMEDLVAALELRDRDAAIDALHRTDPTMILNPA
ncbi:FCD domain-containing protein [Rhodococcus sp. G-MC3]|uniref:FadR/GntR family transcriptional regulator n=1 Tax=Rhodococcus sp. G-MC3 TaxID=3046209 RepID=UPI0024B9CDF7|nr:FCD domain-containing protein [Rhodococcus sp. G-MC3]MDJ0396396.1 FCD domain-containing protein [Rhodococcus sp. G-MC3]